MVHGEFERERGTAVTTDARSATLTLEMRPAEGDDDNIRLTSFIAQLDALKDVLRHTERLMYGSEGNVYYRIARLAQNSPPSVTIEAIAATPRTTGFGPAIFDSVLERFETLNAAPPGWKPGDMDLPALLAFQAFAPTTKRHVSELVLRNGNGKHAITLDEEFNEHVRVAIGPDDLSRGEIAGSLEVVNLHSRPRFEIYPTLGSYKVTCRFPPERRKDVVAAVDQYVRVSGRVRYKSWASHPHAIDLEEIEILSEEKSEAAIDSLRACAPTLTDASLEAARNALW